MPADTMTNAAPGLVRRLWNRLPDRVDGRVVGAAWATLAVQVGIVATGGLVRLTGSGLGCPTWPQCTADSLVATPEMGIHGLIEFGNRLLTFVLVVVAIVMFLFVARLRRERPDLFWLSLAIGLYVPLQAIIGGITVLTNLNPYVVGLHYLASVALVALSAALVVRVYATPGPRVLAVPRWYAVTTHLTAAATFVTVVVGILVTGSGPHAGDGGAARNGLPSEFMQHVHSWPAYIMLGLTLVIFAGSWRTAPPLRLPVWTGLLLAVEALQIGVGLWQARTGLPIVLVNIHMVLAVLLVAAMTAVVMHLKAPAAALNREPRLIALSPEPHRSGSRPAARLSDAAPAAHPPQGALPYDHPPLTPAEHPLLDPPHRVPRDQRRRRLDPHHPHRLDDDDPH